ncbi:MAG: hypothetical protein QWI36_03220 [Wolbachia endosymbiont of Tyrophagus putrescentiae]|nr:hypothetical protein [Wolbachia endosymbiont of Tyrophagus putrescentiae]
MEFFLTITQGNNYGEISNAKVVDKKGKSIAAFSDIGYFFQGDELYIRNHITNTNIRIPQEFNFLRAVENDAGEYKFALCNSLGNLLSVYKKYDPEYAQLPKFVETSHISLERGGVFNKCCHCHNWRPLFQLRKDFVGEGVDVYEIVTNEKVGQLIDEFIYYKNGSLHYKNYHNIAEKECCYGKGLYVSLDNNLSMKRSDGEFIELEQSFSFSEFL